MSERVKVACNLLLTNLCNRSCAYCFLKDWVTGDPAKARYMTRADLDTVISWAQQPGYPVIVQLLGGEPTLHPQILDFVKTLQEKGVTIDTIFSNGLGETKVYEEITEVSKAGWLINVDSPDSYTAGEWELLNRNLEVLRWKGKSSMKEGGFDKGVFRLQVGITFYKPRQEYSYIIELGKKYDCAYVRCDASRPGRAKCNKYVDFEHLAGLKPTLLNFFKDCVKAGIRPVVDEPIPPCIFTRKELTYVSLFVEGFRSVCTPNSDVFPDLTVEHCAPMRGILPPYSIKEYKFMEVLTEHFRNAEPFKRVVLPRCKGCRFFMTRQCQGYCLHFKNDFVERNSNALTVQVVQTH